MKVVLMGVNGMDYSGNLGETERISKVIFTHAARITKEKGVARLLELNADLARDLVGADRCSVWLLDDKHDGIWTTFAHGLSETIRIARTEGIVGDCICRGEVIVSNDVASDTRFWRRVDDSSGYRTVSMVVVPLYSEGRVIGALQALNKVGGFSSSDVDILNFMAFYSASTIQAERLREDAESARLLRRELELAQEVQRNLLPQTPKAISGLEISTYFRPASSVGGDYYDLLPLHTGEFSFTLGDVSGKGLPAAVLMASIQTVLRNELLRAPLPLSKLFERLNETVFRSSTSTQYSTLFCGVLDPSRCVLTYANAGGVPPLILHPTQQSPQYLSQANFPIGLFVNSTYEQTTVRLAPDSVIVCISDGVSEAMNVQSESWNFTEIEELLGKNVERPIETLVASIVAGLEIFTTGARQSDDITVVAMRVSGSN
jgi:phosphoserine phosphatase RsbU/P